MAYMCFSIGTTFFVDGKLCYLYVDFVGEKHESLTSLGLTLLITNITSFFAHLLSFFYFSSQATKIFLMHVLDLSVCLGTTYLAFY